MTPQIMIVSLILCIFFSWHLYHKTNSINVIVLYVLITKKGIQPSKFYIYNRMYHMIHVKDIFNIKVIFYPFIINWLYNYIRNNIYLFVDIIVLRNKHQIIRRWSFFFLFFNLPINNYYYQLPENTKIHPKVKSIDKLFYFEILFANDFLSFFSSLTYIINVKIH